MDMDVPLGTSVSCPSLLLMMWDQLAYMHIVPGHHRGWMMHAPTSSLILYLLHKVLSVSDVVGGIAYKRSKNLCKWKKDIKCSILRILGNP